MVKQAIKMTDYREILNDLQRNRDKVLEIIQAAGTLELDLSAFLTRYPDRDLLPYTGQCGGAAEGSVGATSSG